jgi:proline iminopeptidase
MDSGEKTYINKSGFIESEGHRVYWEDWGNPRATPIFFIHGGPGGGCEEKYKLSFNPEKHRVIFHDQRGCGRSTPFAEIKNNTTQALVEDIEKIRQVLGIEEMYVTGGSWGSALSLFYAVAHPERVKKFVISGVFMARQFEIDFVNDGHLKSIFPEAWERFIALVPNEHRTNGDSVMRYYAEKIRSTDKIEAQKHAVEWTIWEYTLCSIHYDAGKIEKDVLADENTLAVAVLETHYFTNRCFVEENYVLDNISRINHIPAVIVQGRFDLCTPPISAFDLSKAYGKNMTLTWVNAGHVDMELIDVLKATYATFFT